MQGVARSQNAQLGREYVGVLLLSLGMPATQPEGIANRGMKRSCLWQRRLARNEGPAAGHGLDELLAHEDADGATDGAGGQARLGAQRGERGQLRGDLAALNPLPQASGDLAASGILSSTGRCSDQGRCPSA